LPLPALTRLGPYEILAPIGAGGMGEVYKAKDTRLDRIVAIKLLPEESMPSAEARQRFEREARMDFSTREGANVVHYAELVAVLEIAAGESGGTPQPPRDIPRWVAWDGRSELVLLRTATGKRLGMTVVAQSGEVYMWTPG